MNSFTSPNAQHAKRWLHQFRTFAKGRNITSFEIIVRNVIVGKPILNGFTPVSRPSKIVNKDPYHALYQLMADARALATRASHKDVKSIQDLAKIPFSTNRTSLDDIAYNQWLTHRLYPEVIRQITQAFAQTESPWHHVLKTPLPYANRYLSPLEHDIDSEDFVSSPKGL